MKVLFIADIVGEPGRQAVKERLVPDDYDFIIANAENAAGGLGITPQVIREILSYKIDAITLGNHAFDRKESFDIIEDPSITRPANYPPGCPGRGFGFYETKKSDRVAVINLMGRVHLPLSDCPFQTVNKILNQIPPDVKIIIVDFHAEITSEKVAMAQFLNGRVSALIGTHTHVQTADEKILSGGTAYITDAGMTGPSEGIIGMDKDVVLKKYLTAIPYRFTVAKGRTVFQGVEIEIDAGTGRAVSIKRISIE